MNTPHPIRAIAAGVGALALAAGLVLPAAPAAAAPPNIATVTARPATDSSGGQQVDGGFRPALSSTGRYLAYFDLDTNQTWIQDLYTGRSTVVSVTASGQHANEVANPVAVSTDGNRILFLTKATNLVGGAHTPADLYLRDRKANTTTRVNIGPGGVVSEVYDSNASMSAAGTEIAWTAVSDDHVYFRSLTAGTTQQVDVSSSETSGNDTALDSRITDDGKHVVFSSYADNLIASDTNTKSDAFLRNITTGTTIKASYGPGFVQPDRAIDEPSASADGRYVVFTASGKDYAPNDTNPNDDVFLRDTVANTTTLISLAGSSTPINHHASYPLISADGKHVLFQTEATNLVAGDPNGTKNVFQRDLTTNLTTIVDKSTGQALGNKSGSWAMGISADGKVAAYSSDATNLVADDTNGRHDVFVRMPVSMGPHGELSQVAQTVLQRFTGTSSGGSVVAANLFNGRVVPGRLIADLAKTPGFAQHREPITRLYFAFFERQPDLNGLNYWVGKRKNGTNLNTIATKFAQSSEFKTKYGNVGAEQFVTLVYQNVLDRNPDQGGLDHWVGKMQGGMTRGQVMVQFSEASEGKRHLAPAVDASLIGLGMLQKMPTPADFSAAQAGWGAIGSAEGAARYFLDSAAYAATFN